MSLRISEIIFLGLIILLPLIALIDILRSDFGMNNDKLIWGLVVLVIPILGSILYFIIGRKNRVTTN